MKKGTILYVGNFELPDKGASANRVVNNGKLFNRLGYEVVFLGVNTKDTFTGIRHVDDKEDMWERPSPKSTKEWLRHMVSAEDIREMIKKYPDTFMIILYNVPYSLLCRAKKAFHGIKIVYDCTEWNTFTNGNLLKRLIKRTDGMLIRKRIHRKADGLIVVSSLMEKAYSDHPHLVRIPPLVDISDPSWHQQRNDGENRIVFCFAGTPGGNKDDLPLIIHSFSKLEREDVLLRVIGVTREEYLSFCQDAEEPSDERVVFMGKLSHKETLSYVLSADCNVVIREADLRNNAGFPTKYAEAYTAGRRIIASDVSDIRFFAGDETTVISQLNEEDIVRAMNRVASVAKKEEMTALRNRFDIKEYIPEMRRWITELADEKDDV